jgi:hypothetical protein
MHLECLLDIGGLGRSYGHWSVDVSQYTLARLSMPLLPPFYLLVRTFSRKISDLGVSLDYNPHSGFRMTIRDSDVCRLLLCDLLRRGTTNEL